MSSSLLYCQACGAAHTPDQSTCCACRQPLTLPPDETESTQLLHQRYRVLTQVGTGGFGAVYRATDTQNHNHAVAIKQINLRGLTAQEVIEATDGFNREVHMLSLLSHPHLPFIHEHFAEPEHWYIVMDFIEGETLEQYLHDPSSSNEDTIRTLTLDEVLDIGLQLCSVLHYLHTRQPPIIFRDLKPANLMRTPRGQLYLIDFGTARVFKPGQAKDTTPLGSLGYAAPEQYGRAQTTPRSDMYSLGALLHHLLSGHDPSETPLAFTPLPDDGTIGRRELNTLVMQMLMPEANLRPADLVEVETTLLRIRNVRSTKPRLWQPPIGQAPTPVNLAQIQQKQQQALNAIARKRQTRRKFLTGGLAVASTLSLSGLAYWSYWHPSQLTLETGSPIQLRAPQSDVVTIAWSPDGHAVAFGLSDGSIVGYRLTTQPSLTWRYPFIQPAFTLSQPFTLPVDAPAQPISILAWSPDTTQLLASSQTGTLQLWHLTTQTKQTLSTPVPGIQAVAWSPNNQQIALIDTQGTFYLYDVGTLSNANGGTYPPLLNHYGLVGENVLAWSPDGTHIATQLNTPATQPPLLRIWDVYADQGAASILINAASITTLVWSPNGQYLAALDASGTLQVWDSQQNYQSVFSNQIATQQQQLVWSPDSRFLATIDDNDNLLLLNRSTGDTLVAASVSDPLGRGSFFAGRALAWHSDNQHIVVANNNFVCWLWALPWF